MDEENHNKFLPLGIKWFIQGEIVPRMEMVLYYKYYDVEEEYM